MNQGPLSLCDIVCVSVILPSFDSFRKTKEKREAGERSGEMNGKRGETKGDRERRKRQRTEKRERISGSQES